MKTKKFPFSGEFIVVICLGLSIVSTLVYAAISGPNPPSDSEWIGPNSGVPNRVEVNFDDSTASLVCSNPKGLAGNPNPCPSGWAFNAANNECSITQNGVLNVRRYIPGRRPGGGGGGQGQGGQGQGGQFIDSDDGYWEDTNIGTTNTVTLGGQSGQDTPVTPVTTYSSIGGLSE